MIPLDATAVEAAAWEVRGTDWRSRRAIAEAVIRAYLDAASPSGGAGGEAPNPDPVSPLLGSLEEKR